MSWQHNLSSNYGKFERDNGRGQVRTIDVRTNSVLHTSGRINQGIRLLDVAALWLCLLEWKLLQIRGLWLKRIQPSNSSTYPWRVLMCTFGGIQSSKRTPIYGCLDNLVAHVPVCLSDSLTVTWSDMSVDSNIKSHVKRIRASMKMYSWLIWYKRACY